MSSLIISIVYMTVVILQIVYNKLKYKNSKEKRDEKRLLEFTQKVLNLNVNGKFALNEELEK